MAIDLQEVCSLSADNQSSQDLAIILAVTFSIYTLISIGISGATIYSVSQVDSTAPARPDASPERMPRLFF